jgi:hypothetical protein
LTSNVTYEMQSDVMQSVTWIHDWLILIRNDVSWNDAMLSEILIYGRLNESPNGGIWSENQSGVISNESPSGGI